jgi:2-polyprenyl-3-methyl-5-hydroxy-6-metoxy-1,4-benzoquinol methylase
MVPLLNQHRLMTTRQHEFPDWPSDGLERVIACPLCGNGARATLHKGLRDHAFKSAPGTWTFRLCLGCRCAYLDPRPDAATIGLAYKRYFTHQSGPGPADSRLARLRRRIATAYLNDRYGTSYPNALPGGQHLLRFLPRSRGYLDVNYARHLGSAAGDNKRLLDVGCGNGAFLQFAAHLGWKAEGIDNDAAAVAAARAAGCNVVHGTLDEVPFRKRWYQHITLSHVIEHVYDPLKLLRQCLELLVPGGRLWLETPNLQSVGHEVFGPSWRGLEPPRHLVLFDRSSLTSALVAAGFSGVEFTVHPGVTAFMWTQSRMIARATRESRQGVSRKLLASLSGALIAEFYSALRTDKSEFLTCIAYRPNANEQTGT